MKRSRLSVVDGVLLFASLHVLSSALHAQGGIPPFDCGSLDPVRWVDAERGSDSNPGTLLQPFKTITHALSTVPNAPCPVTIIVNPGIYKVANGEVFPLVINRNVTLQGTSALNTVIYAEGAELGVNEPLLDFRAALPGQMSNVTVDSFHIRGHELAENVVGMRIRGEAPSNPTISNCWITDFNPTGIDIVSDSAVHRPKIIHCTFDINKSAITNRSSATSPGELPVLSLSEPGLLNLLSSRSEVAIEPGDEADFYGIDPGDMSGNVDFQPFTESSSGFDLVLPAWNPAPSPGFRPGLFFATSGQKLYVDQFNFAPQSTDLRLNPEIEAYWGSPNAPWGSPIDTAFDAPGYASPGSLIVWDNGTTSPIAMANGSVPWDYDCEGYGNPRKEGNEPDMGADEAGSYVLAGYWPMTTNWRTGMFEWVHPNDSTQKIGAFLYTLLEVPVPNLRYISAPARGNRALKTSLPRMPVPFQETLYLADPYGQIAFNIAANTPLPLTFSLLTPYANAITTRTLFNVQVNRFNGLSNLQTGFVDPNYSP